jgi:hypothetical protein
MLCLDVVQIIVDYCELKTQLKVICLTREYYDNIKIKKLKCSTEFSQQTLLQKKFDRLEELDCRNNWRVKNVNHLATTLTKLICRGSLCSINQLGISGLKKLQVLDATGNSEITDVNHLADTLIELSCMNEFTDCGITQSGISGLKILQKLYADHNRKINDVNHLSDTLVELWCRGWCGIDQRGISRLKILKVLDADDNEYITDVNHLSNSLTELHCGHDCGIGPGGISKLTKLEYFNCAGNASPLGLDWSPAERSALQDDRHNIDINLNKQNFKMRTSYY